MADLPRQGSQRSPRRWRYRVERAWGDFEKRDIVGAIVIDRYFGKSHHWHFMNLETGKNTGGFYGVLIGEHKEDVPIAK